MSSSNELTFKERSFAAGGASIISALVVNPLDVVKTRMQTQRTGEALRPVGMPLTPNMAVSGCPPACAHLGNPDCGIYRGTFDGMRKIARREGFAALWRGTDIAFLMAIPTVGIYLPLYDHCLARLWGPTGMYAPLLAGSIARMVAVMCSAPLELMRTRMQAFLHPSQEKILSGAAPKPPSSMFAHLPAASSSSLYGRVTPLWRGVGATLARDVPFSALYWSGLEPIRRAMLPSNARPSQAQIMTANFVAGTVGGGLAAAVTTPLDVVKTRLQVAEGKSPTILQTLRQIQRESGSKALFTGVGPRVVRAAPACAIVLASYEMLKAMHLKEA
ncbi:g6417 [Coccomyxa viridis]|uniref:G6417 protein n=1 Tax=Coccomyxa viridis TaxID=1274662 RepID=A0ABP1G0C0_9CHLO